MSTAPFTLEPLTPEDVHVYTTHAILFRPEEGMIEPRLCEVRRGLTPGLWTVANGTGVERTVTNLDGLFALPPRLPTEAILAHRFIGRP